MHRSFPGKLLALLMTGLLAAPLWLAQPALADKASLSARGELLDRVVAIVNDGVVMQSELDQQLIEVKSRLTTQGVALPDDKVLRTQLLDRLVLEEIEAQRADKAGIRVSDEQVNAAMEEIAKRNNVTFAQLPEKLSSEGYDYGSYRTSLRREIQRELLQQRDVLGRINISPRELDQYMDQQKRTATAANEYNVSHILIAVAQDATPAQIAEVKARASDVLKRARAGESFAQLAVSYSASQTALEGGSLGWRKGPELPTFLSDVVVKLKPGDVSDLLQTSSGFHLVKLNDQRSTEGRQIIQQYHLRHILIKPTEVQDNATVKQTLSDMRTRILAGADFGVLAKAKSEDPGSAINGGDLGWSRTDIYVPEFGKVAQSLKDNEISEPFQTQFGWHIMQLLGKRDFDNTDTAAREQAYRQLRDSRLDEATELWLQELRDEAYVETLI